MTSCSGLITLMLPRQRKKRQQKDLVQKKGRKKEKKNGGIIRPSVHSHFVFFRNPFFPIFCPWPLNVIIIIPDLSFSHQGNHSHHHHLLRLSLTHVFHTFSASAMFSPSLSVMVVSLLSFSLQKRPPFFSFSFFIFIFSSFLSFHFLLQNCSNHS